MTTFVSSHRRLVALLTVLIAVAFVFSFVACDKKTVDKKSVDAEKKKPKKRLTAKEKYKKSSRERRHPVDYDTLPRDLEGFVKGVKEKMRWQKRSRYLKDAYPPAETTDVREYLDLEMDQKLLGKSFAAGTGFLLRNQKPEGNFGYMYDWLKKEWVNDDNQVRQAGALWGVALCNRWDPQPKSKAALKKGLKFWFDQTIPGPEGTLTVKYQAENNTQSGTVALVALTIIEYLTTDTKLPAAEKKDLEDKLKGYLDFLVWMQLDDGLVAKYYRVSSGTKATKSSPYFDGESLLALSKAANRLGYTQYVPTIERLARAGAERYLVKAFTDRDDKNISKGFYQWSSMSYAEYYFAGWKDKEVFADVTLILAYWMSHVHETLKRGRNHAYAIEGLISAYRIAKARNDTAALVDLLYVIDRSLSKLTSWQIAGPLVDRNKFLSENPTDDPVAQGGIMNAKRAYPDKPQSRGDTQHELRIDVTQHQMHAVTLALEHVYTAEKY
ncbi:MAG: hypothetical protein P9L99_13745 [Candidatus Lernaella stagnicola]|nr:hypothetical protein [Candidatus Lernaella stagnicola]